MSEQTNQPIMPGSVEYWNQMKEKVENTNYAISELGRQLKELMEQWEKVGGKNPEDVIALKGKIDNLKSQIEAKKKSISADVEAIKNDPLCRSDIQKGLNTKLKKMNTGRDKMKDEKSKLMQEKAGLDSKQGFVTGIRDALKNDSSLEAILKDFLKEQQEAADIENKRRRENKKFADLDPADKDKVLQAAGSKSYFIDIFSDELKSSGIEIDKSMLTSIIDEFLKIPFKESSFDIDVFIDKCLNAIEIDIARNSSRLNNIDKALSTHNMMMSRLQQRIEEYKTEGQDQGQGQGQGQDQGQGQGQDQDQGQGQDQGQDQSKKGFWSKIFRRNKNTNNQGPKRGFWDKVFNRNKPEALEAPAEPVSTPPVQNVPQMSQEDRRNAFLNSDIKVAIDIVTDFEYRDILTKLQAEMEGPMNHEDDVEK